MSSVATVLRLYAELCYEDLRIAHDQISLRYQ